MADSQETARAAGQHFRSSAQFAFEDANPQRLRYHLLRLTVVGLSREEVEELVELGRLAFQESDVTERTTAIKERAGVSPLAVAIADVVEQAASGTRGPASLRDVMLGAVLGAYAALERVADLDESVVAVLGAIGGALATSTNALINANSSRQFWAEYVHMED